MRSLVGGGGLFAALVGLLCCLLAAGFAAAALGDGDGDGDAAREQPLVSSATLWDMTVQGG